MRKKILMWYLALFLLSAICAMAKPSKPTAIPTASANAFPGNSNNLSVTSATDSDSKYNVVRAANIFGSTKQPTEPWSGFDPERYRDMPFYKQDGVAYLRGKVTDYTPECGVNTFSVTTNNDVKASKKVYVGNINPDGSFELDVPIAYPQFDNFDFGDIGLNLFLIPGDTLSFVTSMKNTNAPIRKYRPIYYGFQGDIDDGLVINVLADSIRQYYDIDLLPHKYMVTSDDSMKATTYDYNERLCALLDSVVATLPNLLTDLPISAFAKDMLSVETIGTICEAMEDLDMNFGSANRTRIVPDGEGGLMLITGDKLDSDTLLAPRRKYIDLMYDNPLMLCRGWVLPSRWRYSNTIFSDTGQAAKGQIPIEGGVAYITPDDPTYPIKSDLAHLDSIGVKNNFVVQLIRTSMLINSIETHTTPSSATLEETGRLIANALRYNDYQPMADALMSTYGNLVKDVMIAENELQGIKSGKTIIIDDTPDGNVLEKIIAPYRGNVLFLDFWGISCGPCRGGMIGQKPMLAEYADKPFKALYIAPADNEMEACKKWLRKEEIEGEHIFVSVDDWTRLGGLFNFSSIPFGVIIDTDGKILNTGCHMPMERHLLDNILKNK